jgi:hypothetical protein
MIQPAHKIRRTCEMACGTVPNTAIPQTSSLHEQYRIAPQAGSQSSWFQGVCRYAVFGEFPELVRGTNPSTIAGQSPQPILVRGELEVIAWRDALKGK